MQIMIYFLIKSHSQVVIDLSYGNLKPYINNKVSNACISEERAAVAVVAGHAGACGLPAAAEIEALASPL